MEILASPVSNAADEGNKAVCQPWLCVWHEKYLHQKWQTPLAPGLNAKGDFSSIYWQYPRLADHVQRTRPSKQGTSGPELGQ